MVNWFPQLKRMELMCKVQALIVCILLKGLSMKEFKCPARCRCKYDEDYQYTMQIVDMKTVHCTRINDTDLKKANIQLRGEDIFLFRLYSSNLDSITNGTLLDITAERVVIREVNVNSFDFFGGLHGMQDTLKSLEIIDLTVNNSLMFSSGEGFHKLKTFFLEMDYDKKYVADPFIRYLPRNITDIIIMDCIVQSPENSSFARFSNLMELRLMWNRISSFERNFLPRPALRLRILSFQGNPITSFPDDMFVQMPALEALILDETRLNILPYRIFEPVFRQLLVLQLTEIKLVCDCDAAWLLKDKTLWSDPYYADCNEPPSLKSTRLDTLMPIDLCYDCNDVQTGDPIVNHTEYTTEHTYNNTFQ